MEYLDKGKTKDKDKRSKTNIKVSNKYANTM